MSLVDEFNKQEAKAKLLETEEFKQFSDALKAEYSDKHIEAEGITYKQYFGLAKEYFRSKQPFSAEIFIGLLKEIDQKYREEKLAEQKISLSEYRTTVLSHRQNQMYQGVQVKDIVITEIKTGNELLAEVQEQRNEERKRVHQERMRITNYKENAETFWDFHPYFFDKAGIWWLWTKHHWEMVDDVEMSRLLDIELEFAGATISRNLKSSHLEAMRWVGRERHPKEAEVRWVQFKDKVFSVRSKRIHKVTPDYFFTNPIEYDIGETSDTPTMDALFKDWVGEKYVRSLYEIIAYCCYRSYPIQVLFCLYGNGRNGKSQFLKILNKFLGKKNTCSTELDALAGNNMSRFESAKLFKKLCCQMGETNFGTLSKSSILKRLTGGDLMSFELKNKNPFEDYNYAKILIASNSLPATTDTSEGFFRRWMIIDFTNQFEEKGQEIYETIPESEYCALAKKVTEILPELIKKGQFTNQGTMAEREHRYIMASNPIGLFIEHFCEKGGEDTFVLYSDLYGAYIAFLRHYKRRVIKMKEFKEILSMEGLYVMRSSKKVAFNTFKDGLWVDGIKLCEKWDKNINSVFSVFFSDVPPQRANIEGGVVKTPKNTENTDSDLNKKPKVESFPCFSKNLTICPYKGGDKNDPKKEDIETDTSENIVEEIYIGGINNPQSSPDSVTNTPKNEKQIGHIQFNKKAYFWGHCSYPECSEVECNLDNQNKPYCEQHWSFGDTKL